MSIRSLCLATLLAIVVGLCSPAQAQYFDTRTGVRAQRWEIYGGLRPVFGEDLHFDGGTTIKTDNDLGFAFGGGYNVNEHLLLGGEFAWNSIGYEGTVQSADNPGETQTLSGAVDVFSMGGSATWHFLKGPLTPYVSGTLGYTWVDTNIATGPPQTGCWWDPWYGYICDTFVNTRTEEAFSYGVGLGLRWDFAPGYFARIGYDERWLGLDHTNGTPSFGTLHIDFGGKY